MKFKQKQFINEARYKRVRQYIIGAVIATMVPAAFMTYHIVRNSIFDTNVSKFINEQLDNAGTRIISYDVNKDSLTLFESDQNVPEWVYTLKNEDLAEGYSFAAALNAPTCRSTDMPYEKGVNYTVVIDGFIVSDNVRVDSVKNVDTGFEFSDHNPATMNFTLL